MVFEGLRTTAVKAAAVTGVAEAAVAAPAHQMTGIDFKPPVDAWLRADRLNIGEPVRVLREEQSATSTANKLLAEITALCEQPEPQRWDSDIGSPEQAVTDTQHQI